MDETTQDQPQVRRLTWTFADGSEVELPDELQGIKLTSGGAFDRRDKRYPALMEWVQSHLSETHESNEEPPVVERVAMPVPKEKPTISPAQTLAKRIWDGQSPDLSVPERLRRVAAGIERQGYTMSEVTLP
jgi:hypothetical protein